MKDEFWAPTQSPQTMPDGPGESFEAYKAKLGKRDSVRFDIRASEGAKAYIKALQLYVDVNHDDFDDGLDGPR